jgi:exodeoxyribonuclease-3
MIIASWNVNSIRMRLNQVIDVIHANNVDIFCLQEIKCIDNHFPKETFEDLGFNCQVFGQKTFNGVAILSKYPIDDIHSHILDGDPQARYVECFTGGIRIANVYVPNGTDISHPYYDYKIRFIKALIQRIQTFSKYDEAQVIVGDFNIAPNPDDIYDFEYFREHIFSTPLEREYFKSILTLGFKDMVRAIYPNDPCYTWWDYRKGSFPKNHGARIDHVLLNIVAQQQYDNISLLTDMRSNIKPSDHIPIVAKLY